MHTVLVVDDAAMDRRIAGGFVEREGSTPIYAENGLQALQIMQREEPAIVLTDLQMPEMDGLELVRQIRENHPRVPVILMTAYGSEDIAVAALRAGAASYVAKKNLKRDLGQALQIVLAAVEAVQQRDQVRNFLKRNESHFIMGYEPAGPQALISYLQDSLIQLNFCDQVERLQVSTALTEALANAIDHGNLELDSALRESPDDAYRQLRIQRAQQPPYRERRVHVAATLTPAEAKYVIRDDGPGFDPSQLPDPRDPENLVKPSGRGVLLIRTFMDDVTFNDVGNEITMVKRQSLPSGPRDKAGVIYWPRTSWVWRATSSSWRLWRTTPRKPRKRWSNRREDLTGSGGDADMDLRLPVLALLGSLAISPATAGSAGRDAVTSDGELRRWWKRTGRCRKSGRAASPPIPTPLASRFAAGGGSWTTSPAAMSRWTWPASRWSSSGCSTAPRGSPKPRPGGPRCISRSAG